MNIYISNDIYGYFRLIEPELFYFRLLIKTLLDYGSFREYLNLLMMDQPMQDYLNFKDFEEKEGKIEYQYFDGIRFLNILGSSFDALYNFNNAITVRESLMKNHSGLSHHIFDKGVIVCLIAEFMDDYKDLCDEYGMVDEECKYNEFLGENNEKMYDVLFNYLGKENKNWWQTITRYFP